MKKILSTICIMLMIFSMISTANANVDNKSITISREVVKLKSTLDAQYNGFEYKIKNTTKQKLYISKFIVENGVDPQEAYGVTKRNGWAAAGVTCVYGWQYAAPTLGLSAVAAVVASPLFVGASALGNMGASQEANRFATKPIAENYIKSGDTIKFKTFAPKGTLPTITLLIEDPDTGKYYAYVNTTFGNQFTAVDINKTAPLDEQMESLGFTKVKNETEEAATEDNAETEAVNKTTDTKLTKDAQKNGYNDMIQKMGEKAKEIKEATSIEEFNKKPTTDEAAASGQKMPEPEALKFNTNVTTDPNAQIKQPFEGSKNFTSF